MPNVSEWAGYEKVSGSIHFANAAYNYVEMRVTHDAVYLKCIPNYETTRLSKENVIHAENIDMQIPKKEHVPYGKTTIAYNLSFTFIKYQFKAPFNGMAKKAIQPVLPTTCQSLDIPEQPPKSVC